MARLPHRRVAMRHLPQAFMGATQSARWVAPAPATRIQVLRAVNSELPHTKRAHFSAFAGATLHLEPCAHRGETHTRSLSIDIPNDSPSLQANVPTDTSTEKLVQQIPARSYPTRASTREVTCRGTLLKGSNPQTAQLKQGFRLKYAACGERPGDSSAHVVPPSTQAPHVYVQRCATPTFKGAWVTKVVIPKRRPNSIPELHNMMGVMHATCGLCVRVCACKHRDQAVTDSA